MKREKIGPWFRFIVVALRPALMVLTKRDWRGAENLVTDGGIIVAANHNTHVDPVTLGHFLYDNGRVPRYLAKASLFKVKGLGRILTGAGQIPVHRATKDASYAFHAAVDAVNGGRTAVVYPEGTITRDPNLWPMLGKTGAARIALTTGAPVIPIAQWGAQEILAPYGKKVKLFPRKTMHVLAGPPVDLSDLAGKDLTVEVLRTATDRITDAITAQLGVLRGEEPPAERYDMRKHTEASGSASAEKPAEAPQTPAEAPARGGEGA